MMLQLAFPWFQCSDDGSNLVVHGQNGGEKGQKDPKIHVRVCCHWGRFILLTNGACLSS